MVNVASLPIDPEPWFGGRRPLGLKGPVPAEVAAAELAIWATQSALLAADVLAPGSSHRELIKALREAMTAPAEGKPRRPRVVRVEDAELAEALAAELEGVVVIVGAVPELDELASEFRQTLGATDEPDPA
jgi:hypothetical protein